MYHVKLMKPHGKHEVHPCGHYSVEEVNEDSPAATQGLAEPGISLELSTGKLLRLPQDGDRIYVMADVGGQVKTIQSYKWPKEANHG